MINMEKTDVFNIQMDKEYLVVQANELVRSKQDDLTLLEIRIIRLAISQVLKEDTDFKTYSCNVMDLANYLGIKKDNVYRDIQSISESLMKKSIYIREKYGKNGKPNYKIFNWVDYIEYNDGILTIQLSHYLKPYLLGLEHFFTMYAHEVLIDLPTSYSIRLYELLASWVNSTFRKVEKTNYTDIPIDKNEFIFTVDYLRDYFNCTNKYPQVGDFIKRVIDPSVKAILQNTTMKVSYRTVKKGRKIYYIVFKLSDWHVDPKLLAEWEEKLARIEAIYKK